VELGVDPTSISSGPDGRITAAQVLAMALGARSPHPDLGPVDHIERPSPLKAAMAENVAKSLQTPTFRVGIAVDLKPLAEAARAAQSSFTLLLARACALTLQAHPDFNDCWTVGGVARRKRIDIAIAVDTPDGLITPILRQATRPVAELAADWQVLKDKVNTRRLVPTDYRGATFYLSNLGPFPEIVQFDAIVPLGATAILAVAAPGADGLTRLTLSCDHRVVAGADAARMLSTLHEHLIRPDQLLS
jgi:pyruvate dehydrogenase E2 component (dihydrolipoamide acetyltransferase)